jgi:hypothetical protein
MEYDEQSLAIVWAHSSLVEPPTTTNADKPGMLHSSGLHVSHNRGRGLMLISSDLPGLQIAIGLLLTAYEAIKCSVMVVAIEALL